MQTLFPYHIGPRILNFVFLSSSAVRFGRVPKREKAKILAAMQSVNARSQERAVLAELEDNTRVTAAIIRAHMDTCDFTRDKVAPMLQQARAHPSYTQCPPTLVSVLTTLFGVLARK